MYHRWGGQDASSAYKEHLAQNIASKLGVAVLCVDYHGVGNRGWMGGKIILEDKDLNIFKNSCADVGFSLDDDFIAHRQDWDYLLALLKEINAHTGLLKKQGKVRQNLRLGFTFTMIPRENEYQNFGVMSACDVLNALFYVRKNPPFKTSAKYLPCVLVGSSHGGYVANMATKIAPWAIEAVVDNGSWNLQTKMLENRDLNYEAFKAIGFGAQIDLRLTRFIAEQENLYTFTSEKTFWNANPSSPNCFTKARFMIRDVGEPKHLKEQGKIKKAHYICYHSTNDKIAPFGFKKEFYDELKNLEFHADLRVISDESQIDGKLIKHLDHGMGMSIQSLILKEVPALLELVKNEQEFKGKKQISYVCDDLIYTFKESRNKILLECVKS